MLTIENGVIKTPDIQVDEDCGGFGVLVFNLCQKYKEKIALINTKNDEFYTYNDVLVRAISTAKALRNKGFHRHDLVALCSNRENINANVPTIAAQFLGGISYSIGVDLSIEQYMELLEQVQPKFIFCIDKVKPTLSKVLDKLGWPQSLLVQFGQEFDKEFLNYGPDNFKPSHVNNLKDTCLIHFSSGSTGTPKPICLNHYFLLALKEYVGFKLPINVTTTYFAGFTMGPVSLRYSNWYWVSTTVELVVIMLQGGCRLMKDKFIPQEFWADIEKYQVNTVMMIPLYSIELSNLVISNEIDISSFKKLIIGGSLIHKEYICNLRKMLPDVFIFQVYAMTECGEITSFNTEQPVHQQLLRAKPGSCGLPVLGLHYKIVDVETGKICGPNQPGELCLKGKKVLNGFYNKDSSSVFDDEGFMKSGDLVYYDNDFCFFILDRIQNVVKWKNFVIYPYHIEQVLLTHPAVYNAIVIGIPHKTETERLIGVVILKSGFEQVTEKELELYVEKRVDDHKRLREGVKFVTKLPTTASGKLNRSKLKQEILNKLNYKT